MGERTTKRALVVLGAGSLLIPLLQGTANAAPAQSRAAIAAATPSWTAQAPVTGAPASTEQVTVRVGLQLRGGAAAQNLANAVSNPNSASYGKYLTPGQFQAKYAPTASTVKQVSSYLAGQGLRVSGAAAGNLWITATGSVAQLNQAFGTTLRTYSVDGKNLRAPSGKVTLPAAIAADVTTVSGLADKPVQRSPQTRRVVGQQVAHPGARKVGPAATPPKPSACSAYWGQHTQTVPKAYGKTTFNTYICGYDPAQLRAAYGTTSLVKRGTDGQGVTVAIIDAYASPTMLADANAYATHFGEPTFRAGQYTETTFTPFNLQSECAGEAGWNGEETLDVEAVHGMAPGAKIHYIGAQNCDSGIDDALNYVVQNHTADIVSNSYGNTGEQLPADEIALEHSIFVQAAAEGIGMYFSSGDSGDEVINGLTPQPDYSASDPNVTAVGGTSLLLDKHNKRIVETGWETSLDFVDFSGTKAVYSDALPGDFYFGAGGGTSTLFAQPWYQQGTVPAGLAKANGTTPMRVVPDIAADADPYTGFYIGQTVDGSFGISSIGGTSLACPLIAGIQAVASQGRRFAIGFANPLIYSASGKAFDDVVPHAPLHYTNPSGSYLGTFEAGDTQYTRYGYDNITGRGTPDGVQFIKSERTRG
ncbi:MAG TPA: S53 family peptidase [Jatrophihabitans sp.]|nr:S53 family peptidase [Jatrophihabitans sp.]